MYMHAHFCVNHTYCSFSDEVVPHLASLEETELHLSELAGTLPPPKSGSVTWMHTPIADLQVKTKVTVSLYGHTYIHYFAFAIKQWNAMEYPQGLITIQLCMLVGKNGTKLYFGCTSAIIGGKLG